ncbi:hypothetical protein [Flavobacterium soli]|uniref:hypothetical protein n=1 Tax=Flavobacterium soli TaxID=344881 RepID=UPI0003FEEB23|nr:hypothetical protein [Flavobacterium soli]
MNKILHLHMVNNFKINGFSVEGNFKKKLVDKLHNGKKCYEIFDGIVTAISLVSLPSHGKNFKITDKKNRIVTGVVLSPEIMIERFDLISNEVYYVYFTAESIERIKNNSNL